MGTGALTAGLLLLLFVTAIPVFVSAKTHRNSGLQKKQDFHKTVKNTLFKDRKKTQNVQVSKALTALQKEKIMRINGKKEQAKLLAELSIAKREASAEAKLARKEKLRSPVFRRVRLLLVATFLIGVIGLLVGAGFVLAGQGILVIAIAGATIIFSLVSLVALAPGVSTPAQQSKVEKNIEKPVKEIFDVETVTEEIPVIEDSAVRHRQAQALAAERIKRAKARRRVSAPVQHLVKQDDSILLADIAEQKHRTELVKQLAATEIKKVTANVPAQNPSDPRVMGIIDSVEEGAVDLSAALNRWRKAS